MSGKDLGVVEDRVGSWLNSRGSYSELVVIRIGQDTEC